MPGMTPSPATPMVQQQASPNSMSPASGGAVNTLNQALQSNQNAYGGLQNQAYQQYLQSLGNVQQNLTNNGLNNTTISANMQQAPLAQYQNQLLNITGQQQGAASQIYGQSAQDQLQAALAQQQFMQQNQLDQNQDYQNHANPVSYGGGFTMPSIT